MMKLGFSLYPEHHNLQECLDYIDLLARHGASRIFISFLQIEDDISNGLKLYETIIDFAMKKELAIIADISPSFIERAGWKECLLDKCKELGLSGVRLDESLSIDEMVALTHNEFGLSIELNMSTDRTLIERLQIAGANFNQIVACHNFYPHEFTGLSRQYFLETSTFYHKKGIQTAVFIHSQTATEGPWSLTDGLPTLEELRHAPLITQVDVMKATGLFDMVIISNQFIEEKELHECVERIRDPYLALFYKPMVELTFIENSIVHHTHRYRQDVSDYLLRSTETRLIYGQESIVPRLQQLEIKRGMILIDNDEYGRYKGELQIALKSFQLSKRTNCIGELTSWSLLLLDYIQPGQAFRLFQLQH